MLADKLENFFTTLTPVGWALVASASTIIFNVALAGGLIAHYWYTTIKLTRKENQ